MSNDSDLKPLLSSLLALVGSLAKETANLVDWRGDLSPAHEVEGRRKRASEIRADAAKLVGLADKVLSKTDR